MMGVLWEMDTSFEVLSKVCISFHKLNISKRNKLVQTKLKIVSQI